MIYWISLVFQGYEGYGKGLFKNFGNISTCQWNFLLSVTTAFFLSEKRIWLINVSLITFRVQYVVGNMQAGYYLRFIFMSVWIIKAIIIRHSKVWRK